MGCFKLCERTIQQSRQCNNAEDEHERQQDQTRVTKVQAVWTTVRKPKAVDNYWLNTVKLTLKKKLSNFVL